MFFIIFCFFVFVFIFIFLFSVFYLVTRVLITCLSNCFSRGLDSLGKVGAHISLQVEVGKLLALV